MIKKPTSRKKITKTKKVSALPETGDFLVLDDAVSELSRQTEKLLGKSGEKMSKPKLPPKKSNLTKSPKSFDIISSSKSTKSTSLLKSAHPGQKLIEMSEEPGSEAATVTEPAVPDQKDTTDTTPTIVVTHSAGTLSVSPESEQEVAVAKSTEIVKQKPKPPSTKTASKELTFDSETDTKLTKEPSESIVDTPDTATEPGETIDVNAASSIDMGEGKSVDSSDSVKKSTVKDLPEAPAAPEATQDTAQNVQLYSDNLDSKPETTDEDETDDDTVALFDTDEYHPTLHDWSKLEHRSKLPSLALLILTIVFAAGVYIVVAKVTIPFM